MAKKLLILITTLLVLSVPLHPALAHDAPGGSEWIMADWMFLSFVIFAGVALLSLVVAIKAGWLSDLEGNAKFYILEIAEEDYYTPDWAREGSDS
jgi:hypothetical protein